MRNNQILQRNKAKARGQDRKGKEKEVKERTKRRTKKKENINDKIVRG